MPSTTTATALRLALALVVGLLPGLFGFIGSVATVWLSWRLVRNAMATIDGDLVRGGLTSVLAGATAITAFSAAVGTGGTLLPLLLTAATGANAARPMPGQAPVTVTGL